MNIIRLLLRAEPAAITAAITATLSIAVLLGLDDTISAAILAAVTAWLVVVRQIVTPVAALPTSARDALKSDRRRAIRRLED